MSLSRPEIERIQIERFNANWSHCLATVPFYQSWRAEHKLPLRIASHAELDRFPTLEKQTIIERTTEIFQNGAISAAYTTGGSTGPPARYPRGRDDSDVFYANAYLGRSWAGIAPFDSSVLVWGHSHLFGTGVHRHLRRARRKAADRLVGITRRSAYDLDDASLHEHYKSIRRRNPSQLIGYTSALVQLAAYVDRAGLRWGSGRRLRTVILTAETVSAADVELVERIYGVPATVEYGAAETGPMAYSRGAPFPLHVFWDSVICLADPQGDLTVTTLDRRLFPLINYAIGDRVETAASDRRNVLTLRAVIGKRHDVLQLSTAGAGRLTVSTALAVHVLRSYPGIIGIQFRQPTSESLEICLKSSQTLALPSVAAYFEQQIRVEHPSFDSRGVTFRQVPELEKTVAGKHRILVP